MPAAESVAKLVAKLREEGWIADPAKPEFQNVRFWPRKADSFAQKTGGYAVRTVVNQWGKDLAARTVGSTEELPVAIDKEWLSDPDREEVRLVWPVMASGALPVKYPLTHRPDGEVSWQLELHRAPEYVYPISDNIDALDTECSCGEDQEFEWDEAEVVPAFRASTGIFAECEECSRTFDPAKRTATIENPFDKSKEDVPGGAAYRFALKVDCGKCFVEDARLAFAPPLVALLEKEFGRSFYEVGSLY